MGSSDPKLTRSAWGTMRWYATTKTAVALVTVAALSGGAAAALPLIPRPSGEPTPTPSTSSTPTPSSSSSKDAAWTPPPIPSQTPTPSVTPTPKKTPKPTPSTKASVAPITIKPTSLPTTVRPAPKPTATRTTQAPAPRPTATRTTQAPRPTATATRSRSKTISTTVTCSGAATVFARAQGAGAVVLSINGSTQGGLSGTYRTSGGSVTIRVTDSGGHPRLSWASTGAVCR